MFLLFRHQVATMDRKSFGRIGAEGQHHLRLSIATATEDLREALRRLQRASRDTDGFAAFVKDGTRLC
jgi:aspartate/methionine/tyrosine aminotransferase